MKTRLARVQDLSKDDEDAWRRLGGRALEPNPFVGPDFFLLSAQHFEGYADARVLIAQEGSEFLGVLPMAGIDTPRIPPRRVATVRGRPTAVSGLQTPLVDDRCARRRPRSSGDRPGVARHRVVRRDRH